jgi:hypothetical protein
VTRGEYLGGGWVYIRYTLHHRKVIVRTVG